MNKSMNLGEYFELRCMADMQKRMIEKGCSGQVYTPIVDDSGIDFLILTENGKSITVQVKSRTKGNRLFTVKKVTADWFILYYLENETKPYILSKKEMKDALHNTNHPKRDKVLKCADRDFDYILVHSGLKKA